MTGTGQSSPGWGSATSAARIVVGYDGSQSASAAIEVGASLIPRAQAWIGHLWTPPLASHALRRRLWKGTAAGWDAQALIERAYGGEGVQLTQLASKLRPDLVVVGARGLGGAKAVLGSVSDMVRRRW